VDLIHSGLFLHWLIDEFFYIFCSFYKIIRLFEILADLATNRRAPRRLGTNRHSAQRLEAGHGILRRPTR
jgi:hypothetical protein